MVLSPVPPQLLFAFSHMCVFYFSRLLGQGGGRDRHRSGAVRLHGDFRGWVSCALGLLRCVSVSINVCSVAGWLVFFARASPKVRYNLGSPCLFFAAIIARARMAVRRSQDPLRMTHGVYPSPPLDTALGNYLAQQGSALP